MNTVLAWVTLCAATTAGTSITATQPADWSSWAIVDVAWREAAPQDGDWVGAFLVDWPATYISWQPVSNSSADDTLKFRLLNARHPFVFHYFRGDSVMATSNAVSPLVDTPNQGHLELIPGHSDRMTISWTSGSSSGASVRWGASPDSLTFSAAASTTTYTAKDLTDCMGIPPIAPRTSRFANISNHTLRCCCWPERSCYSDPTASELFLDPGQLHHAIMQPITPASRVYYAFSTAGVSGPVYSFTAPRPAGDKTPFTFLATSDMGIGGIAPDEHGGATDNDPPANGADLVVQAMLADPATAQDEFMLLNGDLSYARGWPWIWERFFDMMQPLATAMPVMVSMGNHEVDTKENPFREAAGGDSGGECGEVVLKRFTHLPSLEKMHYSFSFGTVHWVVLSTEHPIAPQLAWFAEDMAAVDRTVTPWLLVAMHRPMFNSQPNYNVMQTLRDAWHGVFVQHRVDFVYTGHAHYYDRSCAVDDANGTRCSTTRDRPLYICDGSAGAEFDPISTPFSNLTE